MTFTTVIHTTKRKINENLGMLYVSTCRAPIPATRPEFVFGKYNLPLVQHMRNAFRVDPTKGTGTHLDAFKPVFMVGT